MLFKHFTWQQFLIAALILSSIWYLVLVPLIYGKQLKDLFGGKGPGTAVEPLRREWEEELEDEPGVDEDDNLMGKPKLPEGMSRVSMDMFGFAPDLSGENRERQQSLVPDALEEIKNIFYVIEKEQGTKADFIALFGLVKMKYAALRDTPSERALNDYIRDNALFPVSDEELNNLWQ